MYDLVLKIYLASKPKNNRLIRYKLSQGYYVNDSLKDTNGFGWLVLSELVLTQFTFSSFVNKDQAYNLMIKQLKNKELIYRTQAEKNNRRKKLISILEEIKSCI